MRPRCSVKPRLELMEERLVLSQAAVAPLAHAVVPKVPAQIQLRAEAHAQAQAQARANLEAQAAHRATQASPRHQTTQPRVQAQRQPNQTKPTAVKPTHAPATTNSNGFSFQNLWKSIFPW